jgi:hypothetical protein
MLSNFCWISKDSKHTEIADSYSLEEYGLLSRLCCVAYFRDSPTFQRNTASPLRLLSASATFLLSLLFSSENGSSMFLQNVGLSLNYLVLQCRKPYSSQSLTWEPHTQHSYQLIPTIIVSGQYPMSCFYFKHTTFRRLDFAFFFRWNLLSWAQLIELVPISRPWTSSSDWTQLSMFHLKTGFHRIQSPKRYGFK